MEQIIIFFLKLPALRRPQSTRPLPKYKKQNFKTNNNMVDNLEKISKKIYKHNPDFKTKTFALNNEHRHNQNYFKNFWYNLWSIGQCVFSNAAYFQTELCLIRLVGIKL